MVLDTSQVTAPHGAVFLAAVTADPSTAVVEVAVHGYWSPRLGVEVIGALRGCLSSRPSAVVIDLHGLADDDAASLPLWLAARRATAAVRPPVRLILCLPTATVLQERLGRIGAHRLPMFASMNEARAAAAEPRTV